MALVAHLVACDHFSHQEFLRQTASNDEKTVQKTICASGVKQLADRGINELSDNYSANDIDFCYWH